MSRSRVVLLSVLVAIVVAIAIGLFVLDSFLTRKAHEEAAQLSRQLGRPVTIGSVATKVFSGLAVRVNEISVGPGQGETLPLLQVPRVQVRAGLLRAIFSGGKDVPIRSATIDGLKLNVIRFRDGTTNVERLQKALAAKQPVQEQPKEEEKPADLSYLRVDHAALNDARIALLDQSTAQPHELAIQHLDVTVDDLRAGKALDVVVKAAVLADQHNLEMHLHTAPLPDSLTPTPDRVTLKIQPIDLAPLGPFTPKDVGLQAGHLDADVDLQLGGVVSGGSGPTKLAGTMHATGLRFAGAQGGKALDVVLDADVTGDAQKGDVDIRKLRLDLGPAGITGRGRATGLAGNSPKVEGLQVASHDLDPAKLAAYYPPLSKQLGGEVSGPIGVTVQASGTQAAPALELRVDFTPVKLALPGTMAKAAGAPMSLVAHAKGAQGNKLGFDARFDLAGVDLRPGQSLAKAPGQRLELALSGTRTQSGTDQRIDLDHLTLYALDDKLDAHGWVQTKGAGSKKQTQFDLLAQTAHLDLDKLLLESDKKKEDAPPPDPKTFAGLSGHVNAKLDRVHVKGQDMTNIVADVAVQGDQVTLTTAQLGAFGGHIDASGTRVVLAHPKQPWHIATKAKNVDLAQASALQTPKKVIGGKFDGDVNLDGTPQDLQKMTKNLTGLLQGSVRDGEFYGKDLIGSVTGPLSQALPSALKGKVTKGGMTDLGNLPFGVEIRNGLAQLKQAVTISRPEANMSFTGGIRLDGTLDLPGTIALTPATVSALTNGRVKPSGNIPVGLRLVGPAWNPQVADLDLKGAVSEILKSAGSNLLGGVLGQGKGQVTQGKDQAQQAGQQELEKQRQKVQQEAQNKLKGLFGR
jgi:AsmA protein